MATPVKPLLRQLVTGTQEWHGREDWNGDNGRGDTLLVM